MPPDHSTPPRGAGKAAVLTVATVGFMAVAMFVGFNLYHADTLRDEKAGQVDARDLPQGPNDLQHTPVQGR